MTNERVTCDICGKDYSKNGIGPHRASHSRNSKMGGHRGKAKAKPAPTITTEDACIGLLSGLSGVGSVPMDMMPEVLAWVRTTESLVATLATP